MTYRISTLVDITNTNARRGEDPIAYRQNQNYLSVLQVIGMRTNIEFISLESHTRSVKDFGSSYKGQQTVWEFTFNVEREGYFDLEQIKEDFDLVPFIPKLTETAKFENSLFHSKDSKHINIVFDAIR